MGLEFDFVVVVYLPCPVSGLFSVAVSGGSAFSLRLESLALLLDMGSFIVDEMLLLESCKATSRFSMIMSSICMSLEWVRVPVLIGSRRNWFWVTCKFKLVIC